MDRHTAKLQTWPFGEIESSLVQVQLKGLGKKLSISVKPGCVTARPHRARRCCGAARQSLHYLASPGQHLQSPALRLGKQGTSVPCQGSAGPGKLCSAAVCASAASAGRGARQGQDLVTLATSGHRFWGTAPALGQPKAFPAPREKGKESGCEPDLHAARSSDPRAADQHSKLVVELCCNPSQVTFVCSENPGCSVSLFLVHGKGTDNSYCSSFCFHFVL